MQIKVFSSVHVALCELYLSDDLSQAGVTEQEPAAWGDAVRLVLKLLRLDVAEVFKTAEKKENVRIFHLSHVST